MNEYDKISPTAKITAYWKSFSDIPFAKQIAEATHAEETARQMLGVRMEIMARFSPPLFEARYKAISAGIKRAGMKNVIELACGLSPRGLELTAQNINYIGSDLPDMLSQIQPIVSGIALGAGFSEHISYKAVNVLEYPQLEAAVQQLNGEQYCFCNEGLIMYLDREEKALMAQNIRHLLMQVDGCWITTDVLFSNIRKELLASLSTDMKKFFESALGDLSNQVARNIAANDFADEADAIAFYEELGFEIEPYSFYDGSYRLSTLESIPGEMHKLLSPVLQQAQAWILRPKKS